MLIERLLSDSGGIIFDGAVVELLVLGANGAVGVVGANGAARSFADRVIDEWG